MLPLKTMKTVFSETKILLINYTYLMKHASFGTNVKNSLQKINFA